MASDDPITDPAKDGLHRLPLAERIWQAVVAASPTESVRIGIHGAWGEGKTSLGRMVAWIARQNGHLVVSLAPWQFHAVDEMLAALGEAIHSELRERSGAGELRLRSKLLLRKGSETAKLLTQAAATALPAGTVVETLVSHVAASTLGRFIKFGNDDFKRLATRLAGKRVVVLVDDLDRCDPQLLPKLLMMLREVLDQPGMAFLLMFDDRIVAEALSTYHTAWKNGRRFLDKVLDFRFGIPKLSPSECRKFALDAAASLVPVYGRRALGDVIELLPANPRKLKEFVRHASLMVPIVKRHHDTEIDWTLPLILIVIRLHSDDLLQQVVDLALDETHWQTRILARHATKRLGERPEQVDPSIEFTQQMQSICGRLGVPWDDSTQMEAISKRLWRYVSTTERTGQLQYARDLLYRPHAITWKEFDKLHGRAQSGLTSSAIGRWIRETAKRTRKSVESVAEELFDATMEYWARCLTSLATESIERNRRPWNRRAVKSMHVFRKLLAGRMRGRPLGGVTTSTAFTRLWQVVGPWAHFDTAAGDKQLRMAEERLLTALARKAGVDWAAMLECMQPWDLDLPVTHDRNALVARKRRITQHLLRSALLDLSRVFHDPELMKSVFRDWNSHQALQYLLVDGLTDVPQLVKRIESVSRRARRNSDVQMACFEYLRAAVSRTLEPVMKNGHLVTLLWTAATASPFQHRALHGLRELHAQLVVHGHGLPLPEWASASQAAGD